MIKIQYPIQDSMGKKRWKLIPKKLPGGMYQTQQNIVHSDYRFYLHLFSVQNDFHYFLAEKIFGYDYIYAVRINGDVDPTVLGSYKIVLLDISQMGGRYRKETIERDLSFEPCTLGELIQSLKNQEAK